MKKCGGCNDRDGKIAALQEQVRHLEARLAQDSTNSSKPPSSDGLKKKRVIPGSQRRPSGKNRADSQATREQPCLRFQNPTNQHLIPSRRVSEIFKELYGVEVSIGSILQWSTEAFNELADFEKDVIGALIRSDAVNFDETGMRCFGSLHWLHNASTKKFTFF